MRSEASRAPATEFETFLASLPNFSYHNRRMRKNESTYYLTHLLPPSDAFIYSIFNIPRQIILIPSKTNCRTIFLFQLYNFGRINSISIHQLRLIIEMK
jgi:hypothetical protein